MRTDLEIAIILALAGILIALAMMAAPLLFNISRKHLLAFFYGGVFLGISAILYAIYLSVADSGEINMPRKIAFYGMIISGIMFFGFATWNFWPTKNSPNGANQTKPNIAAPVQLPSAPPSLGSLHLASDHGAIVIEHKISTAEYAGRMSAVFHNSSGHVLKYRAELIGSINDVKQGSVTQIEGLIRADETITLYSERLTKLTVKETGSIETPYVIGYLQYQLQYKSELESEYSRRTGGTLRYEVWGQVPGGGPGTRVSRPITVFRDSPVDE